MPDKRDMHKAKSHRNSRNSKHQNTSPADRGTQRPPSSAPTAAASGAPAATFTAPETAIESAEAKKNKSRR